MRQGEVTFSALKPNVFVFPLRSFASVVHLHHNYVLRYLHLPTRLYLLIILLVQCYSIAAVEVAAAQCAKTQSYAQPILATDFYVECEQVCVQTR